MTKTNFTKVLNEEDLKWKMTSNMKLGLIWSNLDLQWKTTSKIKSQISQQLLVGSSPNFQLRHLRPKQNFTNVSNEDNWNGRWPQIWNLSLYDQTKLYNEDNLQWKTTSNIKKWNISVTTGRIQTLNLCLCDQTKLYKCLKWRRQPQICKGKYLSN